MTHIDKTKLRFITSDVDIRNVLYLTSICNQQHTTFIHIFNILFKNVDCILYVNNYTSEIIKFNNVKNHLQTIKCKVPILNFSKNQHFKNIFLILF